MYFHGEVKSLPAYFVRTVSDDPERGTIDVHDGGRVNLLRLKDCLSWQVVQFLCTNITRIGILL